MLISKMAAKRCQNGPPNHHTRPMPIAHSQESPEWATSAAGFHQGEVEEDSWMRWVTCASSLSSSCKFLCMDLLQIFAHYLKLERFIHIHPNFSEWR